MDSQCESSTIRVLQQRHAAVEIGFVDPILGGEIKEIFKLRNGVHIENAVKNGIAYELSQAQLAYWRMVPFTTGVRDFLATGKLSDAARPKPILGQGNG
jgi:hypothetical protein